MTAHVRDLNSPPSPSNDFVAAQLSILAVRADELRERVRSGQIAFIDAVDMAYSAAQWAGLTESVGDDVVQKVLAAAFGIGGSDDQT
jgi:hypothetical protein